MCTQLANRNAVSNIGRKAARALSLAEIRYMQPIFRCKNSFVAGGIWANSRSLALSG